MSTNKNAWIWTIILYCASAAAVFYAFAGAEKTGVWLPMLTLAPMLALLLPPLRSWISARLRIIPGPGWSLGLAFVLMVAQATWFAEGQESGRLAAEAKRKQEFTARLEQSKRERVAEFTKDKEKILAQIEVHLRANQAKEASALANKYFSVNKDPDLGRLQYRAELLLMKAELQNEKDLPLERRSQIYATLMKEDPGSVTLYQGKLKEVTELIEIKKKMQVAAASRAALEASVKQQFSGYDGSHRTVEAAIKAAMHNPSSYEHVETRYVVNPDSITVYTSYRGTNKFGGVVKNSAVATVDANGKILSISNL